MVRGTRIMMKKVKEDKSSLTLKDGYEKFVDYCKIKNLRERTIDSYKNQFNKFLTYVENYTDCVCLTDLTQEVIDSYVIYLKKIGIRDTSINCYLRGLRTVLNFWISSKYCDSIKIHIHKADKIVKETYTDDELFKLLQKPNVRKCDFTVYRNWCIINFLLATGVRVSTLINIRIEDIDFSFDRILLTYTKSRKSYLIPMSGQLKKILQEYLKYRNGFPKDYVFCNIYGEQMSSDSVKHAIAKYNHRRGVNRCSVHAFRHTFAKKCVMNGVNVFVLQRLMGHSDLTVTKEYIDLYAEDLAYNIEKYNPLDTLGEVKIKDNSQKNTRKRITLN